MLTFSIVFRTLYSTGILYEDVKEETVGSNLSDDGGSLTQEQGMIMGKVLKV